jgi:hypothetical protein
MSWQTVYLRSVLCHSESYAVGHRLLYSWNNISSLDSPLELRFGERKPHPDVMRTVWPHILSVWSTVTCYYQPGAHWTWEGSRLSFLSAAISYLTLQHSFISVSYFPSLCLYFIPSALSLSLFLHNSLAFPSSFVYFSLSLSLLCFFSFNFFSHCVCNILLLSCVFINVSIAFFSLLLFFHT